MRVGLLVDVGWEGEFEKQFRHAKSLGFDCGQMVIWNDALYTDENVERVKKITKELDFEITHQWTGWHAPHDWGDPDKYKTQGIVPAEYRESRLENLRQGSLFADKLGIKTIITHCGFVPGNPYDPTFIAVTDGLRKLCEDLATRGQRFAFETGQEMPITLNHMIMAIGLDNVGVNLDPANLTSGGRGNPYDAIDLLHPRMFGVHAKDASKPKFGQKGGRQELIGAGDVDFRRLIKQLHDYGYEGDIVIEHEMARRAATRDDDLRYSKLYLESIIERIYG